MSHYSLISYPLVDYCSARYLLVESFKKRERPGTISLIVANESSQIRSFAYRYASRCLAKPFQREDRKRIGFDLFLYGLTIFNGRKKD
jgi:hypothetical protein